MATFLTSPISSSSPPTIIFKHATHLSGATMLSYFKDSEAYLATPTSSPVEISRLHVASTRSSCVSATKPRKSQSNSTVIDTLQKIEMELTTHRSIMLDIQSRISELERSSLSKDPGIQNNLLKALSQSDSPTKRLSNVERESPQWWEVYPNYEGSRSISINTKQLLKTPRRLSGFEFDFDALRTKLHIDAPAGTPEVDDVPALTPTSNRDAQSDTDHEDQAHSVYHMHFPTQNLDLGNDSSASDIVERIIDFDNARLPAPPLIQSPPRSMRSKSASIINEDDEDITALPTLPPPPTPIIEAQSRYSRRIRNFFLCRVFLKSNTSKKENHLFSHSNRKAR